jgi:hypothetical protein
VRKFFVEGERESVPARGWRCHGIAYSLARAP